MNFVIIGGDAAGMSAASKAKRTQPDLNITVLEKTHDVSYSACGMPYNLADPSRDMNDLVVRHATAFREKQKINVLLGYCAQAIDPVQKIVSGTTSDAKPFHIPYDKLLIATGASPIIPNQPGFSLPGVMALKSLEDGRRIKAYLANHHVQKVVIIGMGYIALEMSEAFRARNIEVDMIKPRSEMLPWMKSELAQVVIDELKANGVGLYPGNDVERIEPYGNRLKVVSKNLTIDCDMVLVAIGVTPNSQLAAHAGLALGPSNSISVDHYLKTSDENIYAAGDCADAYHVVTGQKVWIPLALRANRSGWVVADNVCGNAVMVPNIAGTAVFKVFDLQVARTGLTQKEAIKAGFEPVEEVIESQSRAHAHPGACPIWVDMVGDKKSGRLLGVQMVGKEGVAHRINAAAVALHTHMTVEQFFQTDMAYAPPFGPVWDPLLTAANQLLKKM